MSAAIAKSMIKRAEEALKEGNYDKYMIMYETMYDQDLINLRQLQAATDIYKTKTAVDELVDAEIELELAMPKQVATGGNINLRPTQKSSLYKPLDPSIQPKGRAFKKPIDHTPEEREIYEKGMKIIKDFNNPKFFISEPDDISNAIIQRNKLVAEQLVNPSNKTIKKFDEALNETLNNKYTLNMFDETSQREILSLQEDYNNIVSSLPIKKYYTPQGLAKSKLGFQEEDLGTEEAMDEAIMNNHTGQNAVMTNAENIEIQPPETTTKMPSSNIDNLFRTKNIDATPIRSEEMKYNVVEHDNPTPMSINDNLIVSSMEDVESYGRDQTKTENHTEYTGLELQNLTNLKNEIASKEYENLDSQRDLLRELTQQIELLSGGMRDSLFNANDLMTAKDNNLSADIDFSDDGTALSALDRGRRAQHLINVDLDGIDNFFNNDNESVNDADKIGQGASFIGANIFRNTYGSTPVVRDPQPAGDIMSNINNRYNIGEDWFSRSGKREKGFITGEHPSLSSRFENINAVTLNKDFKGLGKWNPYIGNRNDLMLGHYRQNLGTSMLSDLDGERIRQEKRSEMMAAQQSKMAEAAPSQQQSALPMPKGIAPPSIQQIRQQGDDYKPPNRTLRSDAVNLIRLSNKKALELANEFAA